jgi:hypothetical protein
MWSTAWIIFLAVAANLLSDGWMAGFTAGMAGAALIQDAAFYLARRKGAIE